MATTIRQVVERLEVARSPQDSQNQPNGDILVPQIHVEHPDHFKVNSHYQLTDAHHPGGIAVTLTHAPGAGMMTATFRHA